MSKTKSSRSGKKPVPRRAKDHATTPTLSPWQIAVVVGVIVLVAGVLWLKNRPEALVSVGAEAQPTLGVHGGSAALATQQPVPEMTAVSAGDTFAPRAGESPEVHLDRLVEEGQPVFAFFHSYTCYQCTEMDKIVQQVHPEFAEQVALVDVNVYDEDNQSLLQRAGIRVIPTLIFIDRAGEAQIYTGMMPAAQLQETLAALGAGGMP